MLFVRASVPSDPTSRWPMWGASPKRASMLYPPTRRCTLGKRVVISFCSCRASVCISASNACVVSAYSNRRVVPSTVIAVRARTLSCILPYRIERDPQELFAAIPPSVARDAVDTSTGYHHPSDFKWRFRLSKTKPGCTVAVPASAS